MAGENVGAECRRQKNHEVGNLHTCFSSSSSPVTNLVTEQPVRALRHCESGTSVVQVCVPEFDAVNFWVLEKGRCIVGIMRGNNAARGGGGSLKGLYPDGEDRCLVLDWQ